MRIVLANLRIVIEKAAPQFCYDGESNLMQQIDIGLIICAFVQIYALSDLQFCMKASLRRIIMVYALG